MKPFLILLFSSVFLYAGDLSLNYDKPATDDIGLTGKRGKTTYMKEALPLGNGRLGTMFNGGVGLERLLREGKTQSRNQDRERVLISI